MFPTGNRNPFPTRIGNKYSFPTGNGNPFPTRIGNKYSFPTCLKCTYSKCTLKCTIHPFSNSTILAGGKDRGDDNGAEAEIARLFADNVLSLLGCAVPSGLGEGNVRQAHHPMLAGAVQSNIDVMFVGTTSCTPGTTRGVSCTVLRLNWERKADEGCGNGVKDDGGGGGEQRGGEQRGGGAGVSGTWLFDCGQSTQLSMQRTPFIRPGRISLIFAMHCHNDYSFGLPGLLFLMGTDRTRDNPPVKIYGQKYSCQLKL